MLVSAEWLTSARSTKPAAAASSARTTRSAHGRISRRGACSPPTTGLQVAIETVYDVASTVRTNLRDGGSLSGPLVVLDVIQKRALLLTHKDRYEESTAHLRPAQLLSYQGQRRAGDREHTYTSPLSETPLASTSPASPSASARRPAAALETPPRGHLRRPRTP